jgi:hypothetical protein
LPLSRSSLLIYLGDNGTADRGSYGFLRKVSRFFFALSNTARSALRSSGENHPQMHLEKLLFDSHNSTAIKTTLPGAASSFSSTSAMMMKLFDAAAKGEFASELAQNDAEKSGPCLACVRVPCLVCYPALMPQSSSPPEASTRFIGDRARGQLLRSITA